MFYDDNVQQLRKTIVYVRVQLTYNIIHLTVLNVLKTFTGHYNI